MKVCPICRKAAVRPGRLKCCEACRERGNALRSARKAAGLCARCGAPAARSLCPEHLLYASRKMAEYRARAKS